MNGSEGGPRPAGRVRNHETGAVLYREGDAGDTLYVVQSGMVALRRQRGQHEELEQAEGGDFFGELSVINGSPRDATATVVEPSRLLEIDAPTFERMLQDNAEIAVRIIRKMATRIDRLSRRPSSAEVRTALAEAAGSAAATGPYPQLTLPTGPYPQLTLPTGPYPQLTLPTGPYPQATLPTGPHPLAAPPAAPYGDVGHELPRGGGRSGVAGAVLLLCLAIGLVGLIAAMVLLNTSID